MMIDCGRAGAPNNDNKTGLVTFCVRPMFMPIVTDNMNNKMMYDLKDDTQPVSSTP
jgi:hypothetical protein